MKKMKLWSMLMLIVMTMMSLNANAQFVSKLKLNYEGNFTTQDGKIRVEVPILNDMEGSPWPTLQKTLKAKGIFNKDGVLSKSPNITTFIYKARGACES